MVTLAARHRLRVPGMDLPGPADYWDTFRPEGRTVSPDVTDRVLAQFAMKELTPRERAELHLSLGDPSARDRLKREYFRRHPEEWNRLQRGDRKKKARPAGEPRAAG